MLASVLQMLPADVSTMTLVFARVGAMVMTLPALGEATVPAQARLMLALSLTIVMAPLVGHLYPEVLTQTVLQLAGIVISEVITGLAIGLMIRMVLASVHVAGHLIATQTGLAFSQTFDASQGSQSALLSMFLSMLAVVLIFASELHHQLIIGIEHSFEMFPPGKLPPTADFVKLSIEIVSGLFVTGMQMAAPFLVFGLILYGASGVVSRMMPQLQIFFISMPISILGGFVILGLSLSTMMLWFLDAFGAKVQLFVPH